MAETLNKQALALLQKGFSVIPIDPKTKKPLIGWDLYQSQKATEHEVNGWYNQWPEAGIAIITGRLSNCLVFDIDPRNGGANVGFDDFGTVSARTGGGGWHYFFKMPYKVINCIPGLMPGTDVKGQGGYVIVPPSLHPSGKRYSWIKSPFKYQMADLPEALLDLIGQDRKTETIGKFDPDLLEGVPEGQRNESAASVIGKTIAGLKQGDFEKFGWPLIRAWNDKNLPPMPLDELRRTFNSICTAELAKRQGVIDESFFNQKLISMEQLMSQKIKQEKLIIQGLIPEGCTFLTGMPKHYKSFVSLHLADCLTHGKPLFNKFETIRQNVLFMDRENPPGMVQKRLKMLGISPFKYPIFSFDHTPIDRKGYQETLLKILESNKINFLIIDSFRRFFTGDENDSKEVSRFFALIDQIKEQGVNVLIIHHHRKTIGFGRDDYQESMRGSSDLQAYPDSHIAITKTLVTEKIGIKVTPVYLRPEVAASPFLVEINNPDNNPDFLTFDYKMDIPTDIEKPATCMMDILALLQDGVRADRDYLYQAFKNKYGKVLINQTLSNLEKEKQVQKYKSGRKFMYKIADPKTREMTLLEGQN